jgi:hypothetical protein
MAPCFKRSVIAGGHPGDSDRASGFGDDALVFVDSVLAGSLDSAGVFMLPVSRGKRMVFVEDGASGTRVEFETR